MVNKKATDTLLQYRIRFPAKIDIGQIGNQNPINSTNITEKRHRTVRPAKVHSFSAFHSVRVYRKFSLSPFSIFLSFPDSILKTAMKLNGFLARRRENAFVPRWQRCLGESSRTLWRAANPYDLIYDALRLNSPLEEEWEKRERRRNSLCVVVQKENQIEYQIMKLFLDVQRFQLVLISSS